jgi:hypothetical protein
VVRHELELLRDRLLRGDADVYGTAPRWIVWEVRDMMKKCLEEHQGTITVKEATSFLLGGLRFMVDNDHYDDCGMLGEAILQVLHKIEQFPQE